MGSFDMGMIVCRWSSYLLFSSSSTPTVMSSPKKLGCLKPHFGQVQSNDARAKGKRLGRPRKVLEKAKIAALRAQGVGWKRIAAELGIGVGTIHKASRSDAPLLGGSKTREKVF